MPQQVTAAVPSGAAAAATRPKIVVLIAVSHATTTSYCLTVNAIAGKKMRQEKSELLQRVGKDVVKSSKA